MAHIVTELWRYPVKSLGGEQVESSLVGAHGLEFDRGWGLLDLQTNLTLTGRRCAPLLLGSSRMVDGEPVITLPDGTETTDDAVLSAWLGTEVALRKASNSAGGTFENPLDVENDADWVEWTGPPGSLHDSKRTMVSMASFSTAGDWDPRRFRQNLWVDGAGEDNLVGQQLSLGTASATVTKRIDRCVMVTRPLPGAERDLSILKTINRDRESCLGIGMLIDTPGRVSVGDTIEALT